MILRSDTTVIALRHRLLRTAFLNTHWPVRSMALVTDTVLATLADVDQDVAEQLVQRLAHDSQLHEATVLERARAAGAPDLDEWEQRARQLQLYDRSPEDVPADTTDGIAQRLWAGLRTYLPAVAAALAQYLRAMPEDALLHLFAVKDAADCQPLPDGYRPPETAPYGSGEDCEACSEIDNQCRFHQGWEAGEAYARSLLATLATDKTAQNEVLERMARTGSTATVSAGNPLLTLLAADDLAWDLLAGREEELEIERSRAAYEQRPPLPAAWHEVEAS